MSLINKNKERCETVGCKLTDGFNLPSNDILHTVGARDPDAKDTNYKLKSCYENCWIQVLQNSIKSIAFCCIATGIFNFD